VQPFYDPLGGLVVFVSVSFLCIPICKPFSALLILQPQYGLYFSFSLHELNFSDLYCMLNSFSGCEFSGHHISEYEGESLLGCTGSTI
jgi:hypothetical protein